LYASILLPFYQAPDTLGPAIQSLIDQTHLDWELLLIDNNADPVTRAVAQRFAQTDTRIKILLEPQQGIAFALNTGLAAARHPYIARMDADDLCHPQRLEKQIRFLEEHRYIGVVACQTTFQSNMEESGGFQHYVEWQNQIISPEEHALQRFVESPIAHPSIVFRKELAERYGAYDTGPSPEDYELWLRWMSQGVTIAKLPEHLLTWTDHPERLSRTHPNYHKEAFYEIKCRYLAQFIHSHVNPNKRIVIAGAGKLPRARAELLANEGIKLYGFTDVKVRQLPDSQFVPINMLTHPRAWFIVSFISKRGVGDAIRELLKSRGFVEGRDFILAA
jgi:glycosyltransferase involved in cell wall biosynthesis